MNLHHGQTIEKVIRRNGHSISDLAKMTSVNRRSVYNWFNQKRLKPDIILNVGSAIGYDFSTEIPELIAFKDRITVNLKPQNTDINIWKDKYIDLLEQYNRLLSQQLKTEEANLHLMKGVVSF